MQSTQRTDCMKVFDKLDEDNQTNCLEDLVADGKAIPQCLHVITVSFAANFGKITEH